MSEVEAIEVPGQVHYINGSFVGSVSGDTFDVINPATEEVVTTAASGGAEDVALAVKAAKEAFDGGEWSHAKPSFRRKVLFKAADLIEARSAEIVARQTLEMGSPIGPDFGDHALAFGLPPHGRINHIMFEVDNFDDVMFTYAKVKDKYPITITPGKHANDQMFSFYCKSPSGFDVEIGYGGEGAKYQSQYHVSDTYGHEFVGGAS